MFLDVHHGEREETQASQCDNRASYLVHHLLREGGGKG